MEVKTGLAFKTGAAALALCVLAGNAWAAASCARPQDVRALQAAALQQQLMVAALTCNKATDYNRFVTAYRGELQNSDRALMAFFLRQNADKGARDYDAYKTELANASSLRSKRDPLFCRSAMIAFDVAFSRKGSLTELASERPSPIEIGYASCATSEPETVMAGATPRQRPQRDARFSPERRFVPAQAGWVPARRDVDGPRIPDQLQAREPYERDAYNNADTSDADGPDAGERDDFDHDAGDAGDDAGNYPPPRYAGAPPPRFDGRGGDRDNAGDDSGGYDGDAPDANIASADAYSAPYADRPYANERDGYGTPAHPRLVQGRDGRWYLLLPYGR